MKAAFVIHKRDSMFYAAVTRKEGGHGFPGGKIEPGETPEQAAIREAREEGWEVSDLKEVYRTEDVIWFGANEAKLLSGYKEKGTLVRPCWADATQLITMGNREARAAFNKELKVFNDGEERNVVFGQYRERTGDIVYA